MKLSHISLSNLYQNGLDAISFSLLGMLFVFVGLIIIATYIMLLPKLIKIIKKKPTQLTADAHTVDGNREKEVLLAIATAFHLNQNFPEGSERITWKSHGDMESPWLVTSRVHGLSVRKAIRAWRKS